MKDGILLIDKPIGLTSHDVVAMIRRKIKNKKVGHGGTLDPRASGLLIILIGKATKLSSKIIALDKTYEAVLSLGFATDTGDLEGKVIARAKDNGYLRIPQERIRNVFNSFLGEQEQIPPLYSAIKYQGIRLYKLARRGVNVKLKARKVIVYDLKIEKIALPQIKFRIICSRGFYIRKFCEDIGKKLGYPAHLAEVKRLAVGKFKIENAYQLDKIISAQEIDSFLIPMDMTGGYWD